MEPGFLKECLERGMSLEAIGELVGKHPSTVSYWLKKHRLEANGRSRHAPKNAIDPERLGALVERGASITQIAIELGAGKSTIRYWIRRLGLETDRMIRKRESEAAREAGLKKTYLRCPKHGHTAFFSRPEGGFRCSRCNTVAVSERRRQVKRQLVAESGGACTICGFSRHPAALHFHHLDPSQKDFNIGFQGITRSIERMRSEAEKCALLCANCHALVEAGVERVPEVDR